MRRFCFLSSLWLFLATGLCSAAPLTLVCDIWPPYQVHGEEGVSGFSTELVKRVCADAGIPITVIHAYPWKRALLMLETGQVDGLFSANYTEERALFAHYPPLPLVESPWVIWARKEDARGYAGFRELAGRRVGVVRGYSYTSAFWEALRKSAHIEEAPSDEINFRKLAAGRLDLIAAELHNGRFILRDEGIGNVIPFPEHPIKHDGLYLIFSRQRVGSDTVKHFSEALKAFRASEAYGILHEHHFGKNPENDSR